MAKKIEALEIQLTAGQAAAELDKLAKAADNAGNEVKQVDENFKTLKQQLKEAQREAEIMSQKFGINSKEAVEAQKKVAQLKNEVTNFDNRLKNFNPSSKFTALANVTSNVVNGFAAAQGAMALFGNESEDVQKALMKVQAALALTQGIEAVMGLKDAFKNLNLVIKANPIIFIVGAVVAALVWLGENVKAVGDFFYEMGQLAATVLKYITLGLVDFTDELSASEIAQNNLNKKIKEQTDAVTKSNEALDEQIKKNREAEKEINRKYDNEIKLARAAGKETTELERAKLKATVDRIAKEIELEEKKLQNYVKLVAIQKGLTEQQAEDLIKGTTFYGNLFKGAQDNIKNLKKELENSTTDLNAFNLEKSREYYQKKQEQSKEAWQEELRLRKVAAEQSEKQITEDLKSWTENEQKKLDATHDTLAMLPVPVQQFTDESLSALEIFNAKLKQAADDLVEALNGSFGQSQEFALNTLNTNLDTASTFMEAAMNNQLNRVKGNEAAQEKIRRTYFERQKKMQIAQALISTYEGATNAFKSTAASPITTIFPAAPYIAAASAIASGLAQVAAIRSTSFEGGGGSGGGGGQSIPNLSAPETGATQNTATTQLPREQIEQGNRIVIQNQIVETEITNTQNRVNRIQARATID